MQVKYFEVVMLLLAAMICNPCFSWEYEDGLYPPSPVGGANSVSLDLINIYVEDQQIGVDYVLRNIEDDSVSANYSVYLPMFSWQGVGAEYADRNAPEYSVFINSKSILIDRENFAFFNGKDITGDLMHAKVQPDLVASWGENFLTSSEMSKSRRIKKLVNAGALQEVDNVLIPKWQLLPTLAWRMDMGKKETSTMTIKYRARPEFSQLRTDGVRFSTDVLSHCGTSADVTNIKNKNEYVIVKKYIIPVQISENLSSKINLNFSPKVMKKDSTVYACVSEKKSTLMDSSAMKANLVNFVGKNVEVLLVSPQ